MSSTSNPILRTEYGALLHVLKKTAGFGAAESTQTKYLINDRGWVNSVILPDPATGIEGAGSPIYSTVFNAAGEPIKTTDPLNRVSRSRFDAVGRPARSHNPVSGISLLAYDKNSNVVSQTDAYGHTTSMLYDARRRIRAEADKGTFYRMSPLAFQHARSICGLKPTWQAGRSGVHIARWC